MTFLQSAFMQRTITFLAGCGAMAMLIGAYLVADYNTRKGEQYAKAQEHRLNTPGCDASVRQRDMGGKWTESRCAKARKEVK